jgi:hypothetical protein
LKLVKPAEVSESTESNGGIQNRKAKKDSGNKKKTDTVLASTADAAGNAAKPTLSSPDETEEDLDMTGWTGDYNLPK